LAYFVKLRVLTGSEYKIKIANMSTEGERSLLDQLLDEVPSDQIDQVPAILRREKTTLDGAILFNSIGASPMGVELLLAYKRRKEGKKWDGTDEINSDRLADAYRRSAALVFESMWHTDSHSNIPEFQEYIKMARERLSVVMNKEKF